MSSATCRYTLQRGISFARGRGCDALMVPNLLAGRATDPGELKSAAGHFICAACQPGWVALAAHGSRGMLRDRGAEVTEMRSRSGADLHCLEAAAAGARVARSAAAPIWSRARTGRGAR